MGGGTPLAERNPLSSILRVPLIKAICFGHNGVSPVSAFPRQLFSPCLHFSALLSPAANSSIYQNFKFNFLLLRKYTYNALAYRKWQIWGMLLVKSNRIITGIFFMSWIQRPGHQGASYQESIWQSPPWGSPLCQPAATPEGLGPHRWGGPG